MSGQPLNTLANAPHPIHATDLKEITLGVIKSKENQREADSDTSGKIKSSKR